MCDVYIRPAVHLPARKRRGLRHGAGRRADRSMMAIDLVGIIDFSDCTERGILQSVEFQASACKATHRHDIGRPPTPTTSIR
jgi:hypothetical protein